MITISIPVVGLHGGSDEEWRLHQRALEQHYNAPVRRDESSNFPFADALAMMHEAHAKAAEEAYRGADSMWGF